MTVLLEYLNHLVETCYVPYNAHHMKLRSVNCSLKQLHARPAIFAIDHMQLRAYLIRNRAPNVINNHVHVAVAILSGKKNGEAVLHVAHSLA